jgi:hypothetical protein
MVAAAAAALVGSLGPKAHASPGWQLVYSEPNQGNVLAGLAAVDATHAWAVGVSQQTGNSAPVGVRTTDGVSWGAMSLPPSGGGPMEISLYTQLAFATVDNGWLYGMRMVGLQAQSLVWSTNNGGMTWTQVLQASEPLVMLQALPTGQLYGVGGATVLLSNDGLSYLEVHPAIPGGLPLTGVHMLNASCGYAVAASAEDAGAAQSAVLWSGDGAQSWAPRAQGLPARFRRLWFVRSDLGWAAGSDALGKGVVARTTDGGGSWTMTALPDHPAVGAMGAATPVSSCEDVRFFDDLRGVALCLACTANCEPGSEQARSFLTVFARSNDGGASWLMDPDYEPLMSAPPFGELMKFSGMLAMAFPDPNAGFIAGQNNLVLRYSALVPEAPGWGPTSCNSGSGGAGGASGQGAQGSSSDSGDGERTGGCGCRLPGSRRTSREAAVIALAALVAAAGRRRRPVEVPARARRHVPPWA